MKPLVIDLYCGLGGWAEGFLAEGYRVVGFDIERHDYGMGGYPGQLVLQDALTLHGSQFKDAAVIVASPPCQKYSYMAMPWSKAKALIKYYEESAERRKELTAFFDACFRIQREASEAAGHHIPMVVENVRGAQRWVGRAKANYGSYYLWGDVGMVGKRVVVSVEYGAGISARRSEKKTDLPPIPLGAIYAATGKPNQCRITGTKYIGSKALGHVNQRDGHTHARHLTNQAESDAVKSGGDWFASGADCSLQRRTGSKSTARKAASAAIAKIPFPLARHIARSFTPVMLHSTP